MVLPIAQLGQPVLRQVAREVTADEMANEDFRKLLADMAETLRQAEGIGLAAPQVFASYRVFLAMLPCGPEPERVALEVFINPRIAWASVEQAEAWEGCLSFPELQVLVSRPRTVRVQYFDQLGKPRILELTGLPARVVQHEYDHLEGVLTIDRAASTRDIVKTSEMQTVRQDRYGSPAKLQVPNHDAGSSAS